MSLSLCERVAQRLVLVRFHRIEAGEDLRLHVLETRERRGRRARRERYRVAHLCGMDLLDAGDDEADLARRQRLAGERLRREHADLLAVVGGRGRHQQDLVARLERALHHANEHDHADVVVEPRIDDQRLQRQVRVALWRRDARDDRLEDVVQAFAGLRAAAQRVVRRDADDVLDLLDHAVGLGRRQVDLVQHRHDGDALLDRRVAVRDGLRLHALRGVDDQQRAFAGGERARHLVGEVDVARRVDQVEVVGLPVARLVGERGRLRLDRDAALALEVHRVQHLLAHLARREAAAALDEPVGQRRFAVVDVGDDGKVADQLHVLRPSRLAAKQRGTGKVPPPARIMLNFSGFLPGTRPHARPAAAPSSAASTRVRSSR